MKDYLNWDTLPDVARNAVIKSLLEHLNLEIVGECDKHKNYIVSVQEIDNAPA